MKIMESIYRYRSLHLHTHEEKKQTLRAILALERIIATFFTFKVNGFMNDVSLQRLYFSQGVNVILLLHKKVGNHSASNIHQSTLNDLLV